MHKDGADCPTAGPGSNGEPGYVQGLETPNRATRRAQARADRHALREEKRVRTRLLAERERDRRAAEAMFARSR